MIPIYQRYYSWTEKQCARLWDVSTVGHHGTGNVETRLKSANEIDDVMDLVKQAFNAQNNDE